VLSGEYERKRKHPLFRRLPLTAGAVRPFDIDSYLGEDDLASRTDQRFRKKGLTEDLRGDPKPR